MLAYRLLSREAPDWSVMYVWWMYALQAEKMQMGEQEGTRKRETVGGYHDPRLANRSNGFRVKSSERKRVEPGIRMEPPPPPPPPLPQRPREHTRGERERCFRVQKRVIVKRGKRRSIASGAMQSRGKREMQSQVAYPKWNRRSKKMRRSSKEKGEVMTKE